MAITSLRESLGFDTTIVGECVPLTGLVVAMLGVTADIHLLREPTRGGLALSLTLLAIVPPKHAAAVQAEMRAYPRGANAAIIGDVTASHPGMLALRTAIGAQRVIAMQIGEPAERGRMSVATVSPAAGSRRISSTSGSVSGPSRVIPARHRLPLATGSAPSS